MKILLGNNTLSLLAGSESWMLTLATALKKLGHDLTAYSPHLGLIATKMEAIGVNCVSEISGQKDGSIKPFSPFFEQEESNFDIVICAHNAITKYLRDRLPDTPIIAVCHGILHSDPASGEIWPEHPVVESKYHINQYISVSEEVQAMLKTKYNIESKVIRNFIDLDRFKNDGKFSKKPKTILVNSNYWGVDDEINQIIKGVADHYDAKFIGIGANFAPTFEVEDIIKDADIVFGMGRSILEAMAMGKIAVCHGRWGTGGVITPESLKKLRETNLSGRPEFNGTGGPLLPAAVIISQLDEFYNKKNANAVYKVIEKEHNADVAANEFLKIAEGLIIK